MALRVWLPLNGTLENKGISNVTVTNNGATIDNNGKIGKCYYFNSVYASVNNVDYSSFGTSFSVAFGYKINTAYTGNRHLVCLCNQIGGTRLRFTCAATSTSTLSFNIGDGNNSDRALTTPQVIGSGQHIVFTFDNKVAKVYVNGILAGTAIYSINPSGSGITKIGLGGGPDGNERSTTLYLNDVRIYNHCLSPLEVKEISQGLVLHYKLNQNLQILDNCYSYPTFNISSGNGGGYHWGRSGHVGSQGQNTDKTYIYNKENTYSHGVSNGETATGEYLVYQSPAFDGGYRSLQAIIKEENSSPINEDICFPDGNARNGGATHGQWTSITSLGNGFYLCKCEGISQDGSNDLVGIYVKPGYKIYISEAYLENNKQLCSEILYPRNYIIDSSGYGNDGEITGTLETEQNNTEGRYQIATKFPTNSCYIKLPAITYSNFGSSYTFTGGEYMTTVSGGPMPGGFSNGNRLNCYHTTNLCGNTGDGGSNPFTPAKTAASLVDNKGHFMAITGDGTNVNLYVDGTYVAKATTGKPLTGTQIYISGGDTGTSYSMVGNKMSDFRIYATILNAEDIATLYHTPAQVDNLGSIHGFELEDKKQNILFPTCHVLTTKDGNASTLLKNYTQSNCQVTLTDDGLRIYRPANYNPTNNGSTMGGGMRLANTSDGGKHVYNNNDNPMGLQKGHTYIIYFKVRGKSSNANSNYGGTNQMGGGGGGLSPSPSNIEYDLIPANFNGEKICGYKGTINDDIVKTCTTSYSYATQGNQYMSYADFAFGGGYQDTGAMGTDIYITDIQMYDITDDSKQSILKNGIIQITTFWQENINDNLHFLKGGLINTNNIVEK